MAGIAARFIAKGAVKVGKKIAEKRAASEMAKEAAKKELKAAEKSELVKKGVARREKNADLISSARERDRNPNKKGPFADSDKKNPIGAEIRTNRAISRESKKAYVEQLKKKK